MARVGNNYGGKSGSNSLVGCSSSGADAKYFERLVGKDGGDKRGVESRELSLLLQLEGGGDFLKRDQSLAYRLSSLGMVSVGFSREDGRFREVGALTERGQAFVDRYRIRKNPIKRLAYSFFGPLNI